MKVLQPGKLPKDSTYKHRCVRCDCLFEFDGKEAYSPHPMAPSREVRIQCPTKGCGKTSAIDEWQRQ